MLRHYRARHVTGGRVRRVDVPGDGDGAATDEDGEDEEDESLLM
jgi:hypothetical protein